MRETMATAQFHVNLICDPITGQWKTVPPQPAAEPEWKVGDRFESDSGPGTIVDEGWLAGGATRGFKLLWDDGSHTWRSEEMVRQCARRPVTVAAATVLRTRTCTTCRRNCDCGVQCWWCESPDPGSSR